MIVKKRLAELQVKLSNRLKGINNSLVIGNNFRTNWEFGGGFIPGQLIGITGDTAGGKTKYTKYLIYQVYLAYKANRNRNFKVIWFGLEETDEEFIDSILCTLYYSKFGKDLDYAVLNSYRNDTMTKEIWTNLISLQYIAQDFCNHIIHTDADKPENMLAFCEEAVQSQGDATFQITNNEEKKYIPLSVTKYIVVVDHTSLIKQNLGKYDSKHDAIERWVTDYAKKIISKKWGWTVVNIMQQGFESNKASIYTPKGVINPRRVEPSMDKLGNNKEIARDHYIMIGLFNPYAFEIKEYPTEGYDITLLEDNYRCAIFMKNRFGQSMRRVHYWFHGSSFIFKELPSYKTHADELQLFYNKLNLLKNGGNEISGSF